MSLIKVLKGNSYTNSVQSILNTVGGKNITQMTIYRTPLSTILKFLLSVTSKGEFDKRLKELPFDTLYHLFLVIKLDNGNKYILEKNEVINLKKFTSIPKNSESLEVIGNFPTMNELLNNTKLIMKGNYYTYQAQRNNCQLFIHSILKANSLGNNENSNFVLQDTESLFQNDTKFRKIVNSITDIGAVSANLSQYVNPLSPLSTIGNALLEPSYTGYNLSPFHMMWGNKI